MSTFCVSHGIDVPEGDVCKECLISLPEERAIALELIAAINRDLQLDYAEDDLLMEGSKTEKWEVM